MKKVLLFIVLSFSISWLTAFILYFFDLGLDSFDSKIIIALFFMSGPAIAAFILKKFIYKEPIPSFNFKGINIKWVVASVFFTIIIIVGTLGVVYVLGNILQLENFGKIDFSENSFNEKIIALINQSINEHEEYDNQINLISILKDNPINISPWLFFSIIFFSGIVSALTISLPIMFGEEYGWRGFLLKETQNLGFFKNNLLVGVIWGVWHLPLIMMGHNYPESPIIGSFMMIVFTTILSFSFSYFYFKSKSLLAPCLMHGIINSTASSILFYTTINNPILIGITGISGFISIFIMTLLLFLFDKRFIRDFKFLNA